MGFLGFGGFFMPTEAGQAILDVFACVRIISLRARTDRRVEVRRQLARLGLEIDGKKIAFHDACRPADAGNFPSIGARGCFTSHLEILAEAQASGVANVLILEDDLDFTSLVEQRLPLALESLVRLPWSIFYGGFEGDESALADRPLSTASPDFTIQTTHFVAFARDAIELAVPYLSQMALRPRGDPAGGPMHVDGAYNWLRRAYPALRTQLAMPMLGHQRPSRTDIHTLGLVDRTLGLRELASVARRIKRRFATHAY